MPETRERPDPNAVTEALEMLLDRSERAEACTVDDLVAALPVDAGEAAAVVHDLATRQAITIEGDELRLTDQGMDLAITAVRRHRLTERLLTDVIGLEWWKVHHEAEAWEGIISADVEERLIEVLEDPGTCPHGNPIPGSRNRPDQSDAVRMDEAKPGPVVVVRITESLESDDEALRLLEGCGFLPGRDAEIKELRDGWADVAGSVRDETLPPHITGHTYVRPR